MLGDSSSVLASTTTATRGGGSGGGGGGGGAEQAAGAAPFHLEVVGQQQHHVVVGPNNNNNNSGGDGGGGGDEGDRSFGGNRWPREETLALLRIRSDMDVAFRHASVKGPVWEEVSRKLAELGYNRNAKKCKEKFENVHKYHKRTKEGRSGKQEGKTYRFFDQLEAFEAHPPPPPTPSFPQRPAIVTSLAMPVVNNPPALPQQQPPAPLPPASIPQSVAPSHHIITTATMTSTVPSIIAAKATPDQGIVSTGINLTVPPFPILSTNPIIPEKTATNLSSSLPSFSGDLLSNSTNSSSSTSSDMEIQGRRRKRKWKDFFERLMKEVIHRQEHMQKKFLEAIEKREHERMVREESWRIQEIARIDREREILAQERSMASAKDAAVMAFLQKLSEQQNPLQQQQVPNQQPLLQQPIQAAQQPHPIQAPTPTPTPSPSPAPSRPAPIPQPVQAVVSAPPPTPPVSAPDLRIAEVKSDNNNGDQLALVPSGGGGSGASPSRWPKVEVEALIHLRTTLDSKYQENGPKGPLWEEISAGMRKIGYNRNAKRCKEKWENINKYFKKVKESNKKRPEDSKTCPYFHQLDALYREKNNANVLQFKPENSVPLMVRPEQQWPPPPAPPPPPNPSHLQPPDSVMEDLESDEEDKDNDDDDDDDEAAGYEIVPNNRQTSISSAG